MGNLYNKFLDFIGIEENDEPEDEREYYRDEPDERNDNVVNFNNRASRRQEREPEPRYERSDRGERSERSGRGGREAERDDRYERAPRAAAASGGNLPISGGMKMIVYHPVSYEDTQIIIDNLKNRKPVIVNMEELEVDCAQRILDFLSGAVYAVNGTMCKISRGIFVVAPNNYDVVGNENDYN